MESSEKRKRTMNEKRVYELCSNGNKDESDGTNKTGSRHGYQDRKQKSEGKGNHQMQNGIGTEYSNRRCQHFQKGPFSPRPGQPRCLAVRPLHGLDTPIYGGRRHGIGIYRSIEGACINTAISAPATDGNGPALRCNLVAGYEIARQAAVCAAFHLTISTMSH
jgi:hypothetical protein